VAAAGLSGGLGERVDQVTELVKPIKPVRTAGIEKKPKMTIDQRVEFLMQSIESHDRQIGELTGRIGKLKDSIATLARVTNEDASPIGTLMFWNP
jgi:hypothetical protein